MPGAHLTAGPRSLGAVGRIPRKIRILVVLSAGLWLALPASGGPAATAGPSQARERTITLVNRTRETIWPAAWPGSVSGRTGWTLRAGRSISITVPDHWNARLWGRTGCRFHGDRGHCQTGDCGGRYQCRGWGEIPATLAEYDMDAYQHLDFYDVSMVDGSNLPMYIRIAHGRTKNRISPNGCERGVGCTSEVKCPAELQVQRGGRLRGLHLAVRAVQHRPLLLPRRLRQRLLAGQNVADQLRAGVQARRALRLFVVGR